MKNKEKVAETRNINITDLDWNIPCVIKNRGPGPYNSLRHADNKKYFSGLSNANSKGSAHDLHGERSGKIWRRSC